MVEELGDDLRSTIADAIDETGAEEEAEAPAEETESAPVAQAEAPEAEEKAEETAPVAQEKDLGQVAADGEKGKELENTLIPPPRSWPNADRELFASLPKQLQQRVAQREKEREGLLTRATQEAAELRRKDEAFTQVYSAPERQELLQQFGLNPAQASDRLMGWALRLEQQPVQALRDLAATYGLTPEHFMDAAPQVEAVDPRYEQIVAEMEQLKREREEERMAIQQQAVESITSEYESFKTEKDESGRLMRPFFDYLEESDPTFTATVANLREQNPQIAPSAILQEAYDRCVWANPTTRAELIKLQNRQKTEAARAAKARMVSVSGAPGTSVQSEPPKDLRQLITEQVDSSL